MPTIKAEKSSRVHAISHFIFSGIFLVIALQGVVENSYFTVFLMSGISTFFFIAGYRYYKGNDGWKLKVNEKEITYKTPKASNQKSFSILFKDIEKICASPSTEFESSTAEYDLSFLAPVL